MALRMPGRIVLPFGYRIRVVMATDAFMRDEFNCPRCHFCPACRGEGDYPDGSWSVDTRTIYIRKSIPRARQRYLLSHELGHATLDWQHTYLNTGAMKP